MRLLSKEPGLWASDGDALADELTALLASIVSRVYEGLDAASSLSASCCSNSARSRRRNSSRSGEGVARKLDM